MLRILVLAFCASVVIGCTTVIVGKDASKFGSVMVAHSNDGEGTTDPRIELNPAADHDPSELRPVYPATEDYPRYVGYSRGPGYHPKKGQNITLPIGHIPQVNHTYAFIEGTYGVLSEHKLGIAESTCSSVFSAKAAGSGGKALMSIDELSRIAMERTTNSRDAVTVMGELAVKYGFYGPGFEGTGESLMVTDPNEGWVFHVLPDDTATSAIWCAQRVPDNEVATVTNMFVIREVNMSDTANFLGSSNMFDIAEKHGWWSKGQPFDFTGIYSAGEYSHRYYSGRRMWRVFGKVAPSIKLSPTYNNLKNDMPHPYPFSVVPDHQLDVQDIFAVMRDYYQGTPYDMGADKLAAGAFNTPDRWNGGKGEEHVKGAWERPISIFRSTYTFVVQIRINDDVPDALSGVLWFGPHAAHGTAYVPIPIGVLSLPEQYTIGHQSELNRDSMFWAIRYVENLANLKFNYIIQDIADAQTKWENAGWALVQQWDKIANPNLAQLTKAFTDFAESVRTAWWTLADTIMVRYADGYVTTPGTVPIQSQSVGYPAWWLEKVGYPDGPPPPVAQEF